MDPRAHKNTDRYALEVLLLFVVLILACGAFDKVDQMRDQEHYCQMVHDKAWPDYLHTYASECKEYRNKLEREKTQ